MKLVIAIINNEDSRMLIEKIAQAGFYSTKLSTTGGFLRSGNLTLLMGVEDERLDDLLKIIGDYSKKREEIQTMTSPYTADVISSVPVKITVGGATVFVLDVEQFHKI